MSPFFLAAIFPDPNLSTAEAKGKWAVDCYSALACVSIRIFSLAYFPCSDLTKCSDVSHPADTF
jgi:hypothetical protein